MKNKTSGLIALGLAAWAYWKYKMTPEQKANVKDKISNAGKAIMDKAQEVKNSIGQKQEEPVSL